MINFKLIVFILRLLLMEAITLIKTTSPQLLTIMRMKRSFRLLLACLVFNASLSFAQNLPSAVVGGNVIKFNLSSLALNNYGIQYERVINPHQSIALGISISPNTGLPFKSTLLDQFGGNEDARNAIESTKFTKFTISPEYRFYMSKKGAPIGFYLTPFARYSHMSIDQDYNFTPSSGRKHTAHLTGKFSGIGGGFMLGTQFALGTKMVLDWWIVGPFIGAMNADFHGTDDMSDMSQADKDNLESDIESVKIPLWKTDATVGENTIDTKFTGPFYGVRTLGFSLGYRF